MSEQPQQPSQPPQPPQPPPSGYGYPGSGPYPGGQPGPYGYPHQYQQQPGYAGPVPPGTYTGDPNAPYGYDPYGRPYSDKSKIVAGVLQFVLGCFGVGRFYTGHVGMALGQLFTCGGLGIWALIDAILLLTGDHTDAQGRVLRG
ncbi:TM2 domain-containing protein [Streptomyces sp. NPDC086077]|uniref:TM2 domain-containing protein n=1 Tax=Streptomyces sp. NPDC086077 TaxID=3154862 RepID=UPI00342F5D08